jgi:flagellar hook-basal body complex protein FliE
MKVDSMLASQMYGNAKDMLKPGADAADKVDSGFADALEAALGEMRSTIIGGERAAVSAMNGKGDVQSLAEALTATEMALETAVTVRDRVVEAYQEILRMPV